MKAVVALVVVAIIALLGLGGYCVYYVMQNPTDNAVLVDGSASGAASVAVGEMKKPENSADVQVSLDARMKQNPDTVAWLEVPGTNINDSVLQGLDNLYYLRRDENKKDNIYGCYFADYECPLGEREVLAGNTVIYGHSDLQDNADGPKFSQLFRFTDQQFASEHPTIYLTTPEEKLSWEIIAAFYTDVEMDYISVHLTPEETLALAQKAVGLSVFDYGIEPQKSDRLLTLSTCSIKEGTDGTHRFVVMARLMSKDQKENTRVELKPKA